MQLPEIVRVVKLRRLWWARFVAKIVETNIYNILEDW
jgi:hypothetical protein